MGNKKSVGVIEQFKTLYRRIVVLFSSVMLLPFNKKDSAPPILRSEDISILRKAFNVHTQVVKITRNNNVLMNVKLSSPKKVWEMKQDEKLFSYFLDKKWFLQQQEISAATTVKIVFLILASTVCEKGRSGERSHGPVE